MLASVLSTFGAVVAIIGGVVAIVATTAGLTVTLLDRRSARRREEVQRARVAEENRPTLPTFSVQQMRDEIAHRPPPAQPAPGPNWSGPRRTVGHLGIALIAVCALIGGLLLWVLA
jgi:hypothetical protein